MEDKKILPNQSLQYEQQDDREIFTVSEITTHIKMILENSFSGVWVEGEISNYKKQLSGHAYFTLKDEGASLSAVIWRSTGARLKFTPENGQKVVAFGRITVYGPRGQYQLSVEKIEPQGVGALTIAFEQMKKKLAAEGLFCEKRKKPIPFLPERIGIITSLTGAAIRDILNIINRRFATAQIIIHPVRVQGDLAKDEIAQAIEDFSTRVDVDVIVLTRGGGSLEDLWAFNEEVVARAIASSKLPLISAVGHEIDWTIADFVADFRAPTPSAAAELVLPEKEKLEEKIKNLRSQLKGGLKHKLTLLEEKLAALAGSYIMKRPLSLIDEWAQRIDDASRNIYNATCYILQAKESVFKEKTAALEGLSPLAILARGYSVSYPKGGNKSLRTTKGLKPGDLVRTKLAKGSIISEIKEINHE